MDSESSRVMSSRPNAIMKLDPDVVNRIAAGEIIQRPANAIKEMLENSIDAKSTNINITVKEGGLKLIQIQDNGTGIQKADLHLVCERFATSKLRKFEDLQSINTYGFRGEALASISHIAHVSVKTKTADSPCAYQINYSDGLPKGEPKPCAGNQGTLILVEDLYYNVPIRRRAFQNCSTEYTRIVDVVIRYAIHNPSIGFTVKKHGETVSDVKTTSNSSTVENIKMLFGIDKNKELLDINNNDEMLQFKLNGYISSADFTSKRTIFILFINNRLVESTALKKAIDSIYSTYLPKHQFPFIYLSLEICPQNVDVNVHPTKEEVHFLNEGPIIESVQKVIEERLLSCNSSRTVLIQTVLPNTKKEEIKNIEASKTDKDVSNVKKPYAYNMVRTDSREQKLHAFYQNLRTDKLNNSADENSILPFITVTKASPSVSTAITRTVTNIPYKREILLGSVLNLRKEVETNCDQSLVQCFSDFSFVGCVDRQYALIQNETKLMMLNLTKLSEEFFYQVLLRDFGNYSSLDLSTPAPIKDLIELALKYENFNWKDSYGSQDNFAEFAVNMLKSKSPMLKDYFSFAIDEDGNLASIPYLIDNYYPALEGLPSLMMHLCCEVDWEHEKECFDSLCKQLALFYRFAEYIPIDFSESTEKVTNDDYDVANEPQKYAEPWKNTFLKDVKRVYMTIWQSVITTRVTGY
ncbi:DNA mismatch repair protein [Chamberlinius hualienensis]